MRSWQYNTAPLSGNAFNESEEDLVNENHTSPVVDIKKQQLSPQTPGSQALPRWGMPADQYLDADGDVSELDNTALVHMARDNPKAARELRRRRRLKTNESRIKRDPYITEIYESV
jgi:hypothetical protein